jgi:TPR repeat protein
MASDKEFYRIYDLVGKAGAAYSGLSQISYYIDWARSNKHSLRGDFIEELMLAGVPSDNTIIQNRRALHSRVASSCARLEASGDADDLLMLGLMFKTGYVYYGGNSDDPQNREKALDCFRRAAEMGCEGAAAELEKLND